METVIERPAALDVHKASVTACVRVPASDGVREQHVEEFASSRRAAEWVKENLSTTVDPPTITEGSTVLQF